MSDAIREVGECVRTYAELAADDAQPALDRLWARIEGQLGSSEARAVVAPQPVRRADAAPAPGGPFAALGRWFERHWSQVTTGAVAAAAAAIFTIVVTRPGAGPVSMVPPERLAPAAVPRNGAAPRGAPGTVPVRGESQPPEVENLEVHGAGGTVLTIPGEAGDSASIVIWLSDPENAVEGPL